MLIQTDLFQWAEKENHILPLNMTQEKNLRERNILDGCQKFKIKMFFSQDLNLRQIEQDPL